MCLGRGRFLTQDFRQVILYFLSKRKFQRLLLESPLSLAFLLVLPSTRKCSLKGQKGEDSLPCFKDSKKLPKHTRGEVALVESLFHVTTDGA